jgi:mannose-6-phosphate isomerase-like protein (cupin superfamily)
MAKAGQVLDMSPLGMIFTVVKTKSETDGKSLDLEWEVLPGCNMKDPLFHTHPNAIETYRILEGEMEFYVKDKWISARKGDHLLVEKGVTHTFRNPGTEIVKVYNTHEPAFNMEHYFEDICKVLDRATENRTREIHMKSPKTMLLMGVLMNKYRQEIIAVNPPDFLIRLMAKIGKVLKVTY